MSYLLFIAINLAWKWHTGGYIWLAVTSAALSQGEGGVMSCECARRRNRQRSWEACCDERHTASAVVFLSCRSQRERCIFREDMRLCASLEDTEHSFVWEFENRHWKMLCVLILDNFSCPYGKRVMAKIHTQWVFFCLINSMCFIADKHISADPGQTWNQMIDLWWP